MGSLTLLCREVAEPFASMQTRVLLTMINITTSLSLWKKIAHCWMNLTNIFRIVNLIYSRKQLINKLNCQADNKSRTTKLRFLSPAFTSYYNFEFFQCAHQNIQAH